MKRQTSLCLFCGENPCQCQKSATMKPEAILASTPKKRFKSGSSSAFPTSSVSSLRADQPSTPVSDPFQEATTATFASSLQAQDAERFSQAHLELVQALRNLFPILSKDSQEEVLPIIEPSLSAGQFKRKAQIARWIDERR